LPSRAVQSAVQRLDRRHKSRKAYGQSQGYASRSKQFMKLRLVEAEYKSPKTVSDGGGGKMILPSLTYTRMARSHHRSRQKKPWQYLFGKRKNRNRKAPYRAAR